MGFVKYANAEVVDPRVNKTAWNNIRTASFGTPVDLIEQASAIFAEPFNPSKFLLTHATIVASVDVVDAPNAKLGSHVENGFKVNRKFGDYRLKTDSQRFVNNNNDCWSRGVLKLAHPTFVGAHNFVEHVQIEELSKGRIIDAVARDIGPSIYTDILIATELKHAPLIRSIRSGEMSTLSMGCTVDFTICTKCGHVAADETEMCPHVKYQKGNTYIDPMTGQILKIAELCGHESVDPTGGVVFIEASWVKTPAFTGAVLRNVLQPSKELSRQIEAVLASPPKKWSEDTQVKAAADARLSQWEEEETEGEGEEEEEEAKSPLDDVKDEVEQHILDQTVKKLKKKVKEDAAKDELGVLPSSASPNENVNKWSAERKTAARHYVAALKAIATTASSDVALMNGVATFNQSVGIQIPVHVYRAALQLGARSKYASEAAFRKACRQALGRKPYPAEFQQVLAMSTLLTRRHPSATTLDGGQNEHA